MSLAAARKQEETTTPIPDYLVYEVVKGIPIYYKGYKEVLNGTKTIEEIKMESRLQSWLKAKITMLIGLLLEAKGFEMHTGELGLHLPQQTKRVADIAIVKKEDVVLDEYFADLPPEIIIEIDVTADTGKQSEMDYVNEKIDDYLNFGVKKVVWIFSKTQKIIIADKSYPWLIYNWDKDIELVEDVSFNLDKIMSSRKK